VDAISSLWINGPCTQRVHRDASLAHLAYFAQQKSYFVVMIAIVVLYDFRDRAWVILPLAWVIERACNGVWHVGWVDSLP
jgi:hypothetical protein